ncbi:hypothetical protein Tdes44962_MAKER00760 [Teratosphaeria destructans]|uniref:Uncharacterized protein n=1 Tax=Teratosphaeria destructans TaxID=418781 RepID=A0A9W7SLV1_9PEZI|nr:hypothetical protein Tdes44962_MAKER00760 [Teratosphaeria destructans]
MFFLPATSVAAVLDLGWFSHGIFEEMKYLWVYFLVSFGLTAIVLVAWYYWLWRRMRRVNGSEMAAFLKEPLPGRKTV